MSEVPIELLRSQIKDDYYRYHHTLDEVLFKYRRYPEEEVKRILWIYDLSKEPTPKHGYRWIPEQFRKEWDETCRRINPEAWSGRQ